MKKLLIIAAATVALSGCMSNQYSDQNHYMLRAKLPVKLATTPISTSIEVQGTIANAPYNKSYFIYKLANGEFKTDYYNTFFIAPQINLTNNILDNMTQSGLFKTVTGTQLQIPSDYILKSKLDYLYANYTNHKAPSADIKIQFMLIKNNKIVFNKAYAASTPLNNKDTASLLAGWNHSLTAILDHFDQDLYTLFQGGKSVNTVTHPATKAASITTAMSSKTTAAQAVVKKPSSQQESFLTLNGEKPKAAAPAVQAKPAAPKAVAKPKAKSQDEGFLTLKQ